MPTPKSPYRSLLLPALIAVAGVAMEVGAAYVTQALRPWAYVLYGLSALLLLLQFILTIVDGVEPPPPDPFGLPPRPRLSLPRSEERGIVRWLSGEGGPTPKTAIVGPAGQGKTVLARRVMYQLRRRMANRILWLDMAEMDVAGALRLIADFFGAEDSRSSAGRTAFTAAYDALENASALIVLDDLHPAQHQDVETLLSLPCAVIVTSTFIHSPYVRSFALGPLPERDWPALLARRRAGSWLEQLPLPEVLARLADRLPWEWFGRLRNLPDVAAVPHVYLAAEGSPMALDIAARAVTGRPAGALAQWAEEMQGARTNLLAQGEQSELAVRASLALSYRHLSATDQVRLSLLAIRARRPLAVSLVSALWGVPADRVRASMGLLVAAGLVEALPRRQWQLHLLVHDFARGLLPGVSTEASTARGRLAGYYAGLIRDQGTEAYAQLDAEWPDFSQAVTWAVTAQADDAAVSLAVGARDYLATRQRRPVARAWLESALPAAGRLKNRSLQLDLLESLGSLCLEAGPYAEAHRYLLAAHRLIVAGDGPGRSARLAERLGRAAALVGRYTSSSRYLDEALGYYAQASDWSGGAHAVSCKVDLLLQTRQVAAAAALCTQAYYQRMESLLGPGPALGRIATDMGRICAAQGNDPQAATHYGRALTLRAEGASHADQALTYVYLAQLDHSQKRLSEARSAYHRARTLTRSASLLLEYGQATAGLAAVAADCEDLAGATKLYGEALTRYQVLGYRPGQIHIFMALGSMALAQRRFEDAAACFRQVLDWFAEWAIEEEWAWGDAAYAHGYASERLGRLSDAHSSFGRAADIYSGAGESDRAASAACESGRIAALLGDAAEANERYGQALRIYRADSAAVSRAAHVLAMWGELAIGQERYPQAEEMLEEAARLAQHTPDAQISLGMGALAQARGDYETAGRLYWEALGQARAGQRTLVGDALLGLGRAAMMAGEFPEAQRYLTRGLAEHERSSNEPGWARAHNSLAELALARGRHDRAQAHLTNSLAVAERLCLPVERWTGLVLLAAVESVHNADATAKAHLEEALRLAKGSAGSEPPSPPDTAVDQAPAATSLPTAEMAGCTPRRADILCRLGDVAVALGDYAQADQRYAAALEIYHRLSAADDEWGPRHQRSVRRLILRQAGLALMDDRREQARTLYHEAQGLYAEAGDLEGAWSACQRMAAVWEQCGEPKLAARMLLHALTNSDGSVTRAPQSLHDQLRRLRDALGETCFEELSQAVQVGAEPW